MSFTFGTDGRTIDGSHFIEAIFGGTTQLNGSIRRVAGPGATIVMIPGEYHFRTTENLLKKEFMI